VNAAAARDGRGYLVPQRDEPTWRTGRHLVNARRFRAVPDVYTAGLNTACNCEDNASAPDDVGRVSAWLMTPLGTFTRKRDASP